MYFRIFPNSGGIRLHRYTLIHDGGGISGGDVSTRDIQIGAGNSINKELQLFYLAIQVLSTGEKKQSACIKRLATAGARDIKTDIKCAAEYLEIYRYPAIVKKLNYWKNRDKTEMANFNELNDLLRTSLAPIKEKLRLPAVNPSEFSYTVPDAVVTRVRSTLCKNYLKSLITYNTLTKFKFDQVVHKLQRDFPENAEEIIAGIRTTQSKEHLSAISFNDENHQLLITIVNVSGDLIQLEGYKFLRLIEEHDNVHGGWLSLGSLNRKGDWLPDPLIKLNKELNGELIARYSALESCLEVKCRTTDMKSNKSGISAQAVFILDQDYMICLYIAVLRLKNDKQRFEVLREVAETKVVANMADLEDDLFG